MPEGLSYLGSNARVRALVGVLCLTAGACRTRDFDSGQTSASTSAASKAADEPREETVHMHAGPRSPFDKSKEDDSDETSEEPSGLVAAKSGEWACISRQEVTMCRGANGTGVGSVIWIRYRGRLLERAESAGRLFGRITSEGLTESFKMSSDARGAYLLLTNGLAHCVTRDEVRVEESKPNVRCIAAPARMKKMFEALAKSAPDEPWKIKIGFGMTVKKPGDKTARTEFDEGSPPYLFELPERLPAETTTPDAPAPAAEEVQGNKE